MGDRTGSHDEFAFEFVVGLYARPAKAHGEKGARRGYQATLRIASVTNTRRMQIFEGHFSKG